MESQVELRMTEDLVNAAPHLVHAIQAEGLTVITRMGQSRKR